ncbi:hypothetical protein [Nocardioides daejeonensis]|uniref:hypothetical protein n=1 Tax=Nocardioides daejeonensis TaxID=1046556 RepID=UPI000D74E692|nr:hypothetical protein [Nocardioides daejeonensis]
MGNLEGSRYDALSRAELAALVPELLLVGQLIDRSGMAWCIGALGREEMARIAIDEWAAASPIYTRRMQQALRYEGDDVITIFKGLQLDIGAPPQFMDFRYTVHDRRNGEFHLDHCGALVDVEPMGPDYVRSMCHDIEDPTFDATAVATNPRAQVRPIHRPPRIPADRSPHCAWTVRIDDSHPPVQATELCLRNQVSRAATLELAPIDPADEGLADYSGPLLSDLDFSAFSRSALVRIADEVCLQMHLLTNGFRMALAARLPEKQARDIAVRTLVGIAGIATERIRRAVVGAGPLDLICLHPLLNPAAYVELSRSEEALRVHPGPAHEDGAWIALCGPSELRPLQALVRAIDPLLGVEVTGSDQEWTLRLVEREAPAAEADEVAVTRISTGAGFEFSPRRSLPLYPVSGSGAP